jgi:hypothetical protein
VEMDASYIKGMLNSPDIHPVAVLNRWITAIKLFDFSLRHVPATRIVATDGLSRRPLAPEDPEEPNDADDWIDRQLDSYNLREIYFAQNPINIYTDSTAEASHISQAHTYVADSAVTLPYSNDTRRRDEWLSAIHQFLKTLERPSGLSKEDFAKLSKDAGQFFEIEDRLYRRNRQGRHQRVIPVDGRLPLLREAHDKLGHRGFFPVRQMLLERFWWPNLAQDIRWFIKTCYQCQIRSFFKLKLPPTVASVPSLFQKAYIDTMHMPRSNGFKYLVQARCALTSYVEWRPLRRETQRTLSSFVFEDIICRWGCLSEIVTDNGAAFVAACGELAAKYNINYIRISPYNSQANGVVERTHRDFRESLIKSCDGDASRWISVAPYVAWADRITTRKATGHSPFFMVHGVEPVMPFDLSEATYLFPKPDTVLSTSELITIRSIQLMKRETDIAKYQTQISRRRFLAARAYEEKYAATIHNYDFKPGRLVLVRDKRIEKDFDKKILPRYNGPYIVVSRTQRGSYRIAELDGTISKLRISASRVVPFHHRPHTILPIVPLGDDKVPVTAALTEDSGEDEDELTGDSQL